MAQQKLTKQQKEAKIAAAQKRQEEALRKNQFKEKMKKLGIIIVCIVLVLGLTIPTVALSVLSGS